MDRWTEKLSEYLDETLPAGEREALDAHLTKCAECRETLDELRRVVDRARGLDDRPPSKDLWSGIATRIGSGTAVVSIDRARVPARTARRLSFSVPQALAAGIALMIVSSGAVWLSLRSHGSIQPPADTSRSIDMPAAWHQVDSSVDPVVANLRNVLQVNRAQLSDSTVRILEKNLAIIDSAIAEARRALDADPNNSYLNRHLADVVQRRADLLRRVSTLGVRT
ncbi:MAG TPA: zf-HC2 domain-containing protein [Gemmatimonadales bacterium]|nr:zf-HC2 domain-containing protein [Gemmatimonadales bacterium]